MPQDLKDKNLEAIHQGDDVFTPIRGGKHQGKVEEIVQTEQDAQETGTKHPPKVLGRRTSTNSFQKMNIAKGT